MREAASKTPSEPTQDSASQDYEVGYGKPPVNTRFKPGQSGNPQGRPKGTRNLKSDLVEELGERITVREGGQSQKVTKQRALIKTLMTRTLKGDARAANLLLSMMSRLLDLDDGSGETEVPLEEDERAILEAYAERRQRGDNGSAADKPDDRNTESKS